MWKVETGSQEVTNRNLINPDMRTARMYRNTRVKANGIINHVRTVERLLRITVERRWEYAILTCIMAVGKTKTQFQCLHCTWNFVKSFRASLKQSSYITDPVPIN